MESCQNQAPSALWPFTVTVAAFSKAEASVGATENSAITAMPTPYVSSSPSNVETCTGDGAAELDEVVNPGVDAPLDAEPLGLAGTATAVLAAVGLPAPPPVPGARVEASGTEGVTVTTTTPPAPQPATTPRAATAAAMPARRAARR